MSNLALLNKQHDEIAGLMSSIEKILINGVSDSTAKEIAFGINTMSGKLKMHLMSEDQHLYPQLMNSDNPNLRTTAQGFYSEMGQLSEVFSKFVQDYNVPSKILKDINIFRADCKKVFDAIGNRIKKEHSKLYPLIET